MYDSDAVRACSTADLRVRPSHAEARGFIYRHVFFFFYGRPLRRGLCSFTAFSKTGSLNENAIDGERERRPKPSGFFLIFFFYENPAQRSSRREYGEYSK